MAVSEWIFDPPVIDDTLTLDSVPRAVDEIMGVDRLRTILTEDCSLRLEL